MLKRNPKPQVKVTDAERLAVELGKRKSGSENHAKSAWRHYTTGGQKGARTDEK